MSQATLSGGYHNSNLFSNYYLDERVYDLDAWDCDEEASEVYEELQSLYDAEGEALGSYKEDPLLKEWIDEVLDALGYQTLSESTLPDGGGYVDRLLFDSADDRRDAANLSSDGMRSAAFKKGIGVLEAKQWGTDFESSFNEDRQYRNASHQIKFYLESTPENIDWGILTDGKKWRLYGTKDYETNTFYEVDLPELLLKDDLEAFKRFYVFFRSEAFREVSGTTFLDEVWSESETAAQELGEDLQDNVFTALRVLGEGFVESNDLGIDPDDDEAMEELKEQSLVLLYRLMFLLYAEGRGLIHPEGPHAQQEYQENFSLEQIRKNIYDEVAETGDFDAEYSEHATKLWSQLQDLFDLVETGNDDLGIPPYNGGLFDDERHEFLAEHEVSDRHLAEVIYRISTTESEQNGGDVLADYADLDTRHLGSIYEGLLEHRFRIASEDMAAVEEDGAQEWMPATEVSVADAVETVEEGELFVINDDGERKATGAYYTPDYVVTYIVEETVDPLLEDIREDLEADGYERGESSFVYEFALRVKDLKVLDPAMGSGHFLTKATGYLTEQIMAEAREAEVGTLFDEQRIKRQIAKECIYGVDLNEMATELAKLSMWLETLAADQPLAFLDHHLKTGNSLVGSDIKEIEGLESDANGDDEQASLAEFGATRQGTIERLMDIYQEFLSIENEDLDDVKAMERKYREIEQDELRQRLVAMADVLTAEEFGIDVPENVYEWIARALEDDSEWKVVAETDWFKKASELASVYDFHHWKLEFPEIFYTEEGKVKENSGFDVVVGNPPYVSNWELTEADETIVSSLENLYPDATLGHWDLYVPFCYRATTLTRDSGLHSFITPSSLSTEKYGANLREYFITHCSINKLVNFDSHRVFSDIDRQYLIYIVSPGSRTSEKTIIVEYQDHEFQEAAKIAQKRFLEYSNSSFRLDITDLDISIKSKIDSESIFVGNLCWVNPGVVAHSASDSPLNFDKSDVVHTEKEESDWKKYVSGSNIQRHSVQWEGKYMDYDSKREHFHRPKFPELFESEKIMFSGVSGAGSVILSCFDDHGYYTNHNVNHAVLWADEILEYKSPSDYDPVENIQDYDIRYVSGVVNSSVDNYYFKKFLATGTLQGSYTGMYPGDIRALPVPQIDNPHAVLEVDGLSNMQLPDHISGENFEYVLSKNGEITEEIPVGQLRDLISNLTEAIVRMNEEINQMNHSITDYLGNYSQGPALADLSPMPPSGLADSILTNTEETRDSLRVGSVDLKRADEELIVLLSARYKPEEEDGYETDQWGYTETDLEPAMKFTGLDKEQAMLIEAFVPYAVEEARGFAEFRETATKTNSLIDRLEELTLPKLDDVADGLQRYQEAKERAAELDEKIEQTDELIDEIVYELYGLTDKEIEIVEEAIASGSTSV